MKFTPDDLILSVPHDPVIDELIEKARQGKLTVADLEMYAYDPFSNGRLKDPLDVASSIDSLASSMTTNIMIRRRYCQEVSFAAYTVEYIDSLTKLVGNRRVLEVCAGNGILGPIMRARGIDWTCTDLRRGTNRFCNRPAKGLIIRGARHAVETIPHDIIFASWIPIGHEIDVYLAQQKTPLIIVGEIDATTGSAKFFKQYGDMLERPPKDFIDVLNWYGIHDRTRLLNWRRKPNATK